MAQAKENSSCSQKKSTGYFISKINSTKLAFKCNCLTSIVAEIILFVFEQNCNKTER